jgi:hypothetical protein
MMIHVVGGVKYVTALRNRHGHPKQSVRVSDSFP